MSKISYKNNQKYNIPNIQGKYNRMVTPILKLVHSNNNDIIKPSMKWVQMITNST